MAKVCFGELSPQDLEGEERELAREMFGGVDEFSATIRRTIVMEMGRGSGKTTLSAAWLLYSALLTDMSSCGPGDVPLSVCIAPDKPTAKIAIEMVREMMRNNQLLERLIVHDKVNSTAPSITIRRPAGGPGAGRLVRIAAVAASRGGASIRGRSILSFLLDEAQFFASDEFTAAVNDRHIYGALAWRLVKGGKGIFISTPWPVETMMQELMADNFGHPRTAVAARATTPVMRSNSPEVLEMIEQEMIKDPENAAREIFCQMTFGGSGSFFDESAIATSAVPYKELPPHDLWPTAIGCDFAFKRDSSSIYVVQYDGEKYRTAYYQEIRPKPGAPLKPSEVCEEFAKVVKRYRCHGVITDGHYEEAIKEQLGKFGLHIIPAPANESGKSETYVRTKSVLHEGLCEIPDDLRFKNQLKMVRGIPKAGGGISIKTPRRAGMGHGDLVSSWVLAVHELAWARVKDRKITPNMPEWQTERARLERELEAKREMKHIAAMEKEIKYADRRVRRRPWAD